MLDYSSEEEPDFKNFNENVKDSRKRFCPVKRANNFPETSTSVIPMNFENKTFTIFSPKNSELCGENIKFNNFLQYELAPDGENHRNRRGKFSDFQKSSIMKNSEEDPDSFFKSMTTVVQLAQYFAVLPLSGIKGPNYKSIRFRWFHYKILYWAAFLLGTLFYFVCYLRYSLLTGIYTKAASRLKPDSSQGRRKPHGLNVPYLVLGRLIFFASGILSSFSMLHFAYNWRNLNEEFANMEKKFQKYGYPKKIGLKFRALTFVFFICGLVDFLLSKFTFFDAKFCNGEKTDQLANIDSFFLENYKEVFEFYPYNFVAGVLLLASNFRTSTVWAFQDLFLAFVSYSIAKRFKQIRCILEACQGQNMPLAFWKEIREDYNNLTILTKRVDNFTQKLMLLAIGNDLFLLCITLFNSLQYSISPLKLACFFWSFGFQLMKTTFVAFSAAQINDESKEPKVILYSVPQSSYSSEVRRFLTQLTTNEVALTGCGFFSVTRSLLLTIMGTVITYEIVLVQFNSNNDGSQIRSNQTCFSV